MGERKKPKKYSKMGYQQKESYVKSELQKLGGSGVYYDDGGARGSASTGMFDLEASQEQLQKLASNDYNRRESIKYGKDSGDKRFKDVGNGGFGSMTELVNADRAIAKYGYNELGHTNMSSNNDYAAVSSALFNQSRDKFAEGMQSVDDTTADTIEQVTRPTGPTQYSDEYAQSRAGEDAYKDFSAGGGYSALMSGDSSVASNFMRQRADNVKQYLKPDPVSQLGKGLGEDGSFRMDREFTEQKGIEKGRRAGQVFT